MKTGKLLLKNFLSLGSAELVSRITGFIATAYLGRVLAAEGFGKLGFVQSLQTYFLIFALLGLNAYGIREVARDKSNIGVFVGRILGIKIFSVTLSYLALALVALIVPRPHEIRVLMLLFAMSLFTQGLTIEWVFSGMEKMEWLAVVAFLRNVVYLGLVFFLIHSSGDLPLLVIAILSSEMAAVLVYIVLYLKHIGPLRILWEVDAWRAMLKSSLPFALSAFLVQIYYNLDVVLLGFWTTDRVTGWYVSAYNIVLALLGAGSLFSNTLYPTVSRLFKDSRERVRELLRFMSRILISFSLPVALGGTLLSSQILRLVYGGGFEGATTALQILLWTVVTVFSNIPFALSLLACDQQRRYMWASCAGACVNIILNILLIPRYQLVGSAIATITTEVVVLSMLYMYGRRLADFSVLPLAWKPVVATVLMGCLTYTLRVPVLVNILLSAVFYVTVLYLLKGVTAADIVMLRNHMKRGDVAHG